MKYHARHFGKKIAEAKTKLGCIRKARKYCREHAVADYFNLYADGKWIERHTGYNFSEIRKDFIWVVR